MNRNTDHGYDGPRDRTNVSVRQLPGRTNGLPQAAGDDRQPTSRRRKSPRPATSPIRQDRAPDPDRSHPARNAPAHPRPYRGLFPIRGPVDGPSRTPTSIGFSAFRPEPALNSNYSLATSGRGLISPCFSFGTTHMRTSLQNSNSCTPPRQRERGRMPKDP